MQYWFQTIDSVHFLYFDIKIFKKYQEKNMIMFDYESCSLHEWIKNVGIHLVAYSHLYEH